MSILYHSCQQTGKSFDTKELLRIKKEAMIRDYLRDDCYVLNPQGIFALAGLHCQYTGKHEPPDRIAAENEIEILYYRWKEYGHFVAGIYGAVSYDPLGASSILRYGRLMSKRIFVLEDRK